MIKDGYVSETVARIHNSLKRHLADAVELGYIPKSPFTRSARPPRVEHKEKNALDDATRKRLLSLLEYMGDTRFTLAVRLGLGARLRNEEVVGLHWEDVDLDRVYLHIRRALASVGGKSLEKGPKTQACRRDIPIDKDLARCCWPRRCLHVTWAEDPRRRCVAYHNCSGPGTPKGLRTSRRLSCRDGHRPIPVPTSWPTTIRYQCFTKKVAVHICPNLTDKGSVKA